MDCVKIVLVIDKGWLHIKYTFMYWVVSSMIYENCHGQKHNGEEIEIWDEDSIFKLTRHPTPCQDVLSIFRRELACYDGTNNKMF